MSKETQVETSKELDASARHALEQAEEICCPIIELRQYLHHPGRRDEFIALFDAYFIEEQERYGAFIPGQFRDRTNPGHFVWFASFTDETASRNYHSVLTQSQEWITSIVPAPQMWGAKLHEALELLPTRRSLLRHRAQEQETRKDCGE